MEGNTDSLVQAEGALAKLHGCFHKAVSPASGLGFKLGNTDHIGTKSCSRIAMRSPARAPWLGQGHGYRALSSAPAAPTSWHRWPRCWVPLEQQRSLSLQFSLNTLWVSSAAAYHIRILDIILQITKHSYCSQSWIFPRLGPRSSHFEASVLLLAENWTKSSRPYSVMRHSK